MRLSEQHSLSGDRTGRDKSGHGKKTPIKCHSLTRDPMKRDKSGHGKSATEGVSPTLWISHRIEQVRSGHRKNATE